MGADGQIGGRVRRLRRQRFLSQTELADRLGVSASYLNLIEHNRRRVTVPILMKLAAALGVEAGELAEADEQRLSGDLMEIFGDDVFTDLDLTNQDIRDLAANNPSVGKAIIHLFDRYRQLRGRQAGAASEASLAGAQPAADAVSDFLQENANYFASLEAAAERMRHDVDSAAEEVETGLRSYLLNAFGIHWRVGPLPDGVYRRLDRASSMLVTSDAIPQETSLFAAAQLLASLGAEREIGRTLETSRLPEDALPVARNALSAYVAAALLMPYEPFLAACRETRYDIERIGRRFKASFEQVCQRMTSLQRPGRSGIPLHLIRTDIAGNISKRFSLSGIRIPRHSGACPRWNVYAAFLHPESINVQLSQMPDGTRYFCIAKAITKGAHRHNGPRRHVSIGLGCDIAHAADMVYSDGVDVGRAQAAVPIGVGCRVCPRANCGQRAHPPADYTGSVDEADRHESFYALI
jgi:predicted transcriptional regulator/transcriptional regulator with XRE-family HTH domain